MVHKIISTIGLGILGIDPITAVYMISMGFGRTVNQKYLYFGFHLWDFLF